MDKNHIGATNECIGSIDDHSGATTAATQMTSQDSNHGAARQSPSNPFSFSKRQAALISGAASLLASAVVLAIIWACLAAAMGFVSRHSAVLLPPILAVICANIVQPEFDRLRRACWRVTGKSRHSAVRRLATTVPIAVIFAAFAAPLALFIRFFGGIALHQTLEAVNALPDLARWAARAAGEHLPQVTAFVEERNLAPFIARLDPAGWFDFAALTSSLGGYAFSIFDFLRGAARTVLGWAALPVYTAIYLASRPLNGSDFGGALLGVGGKTRANLVFLIDEFIRIVVAFFRGQVLVALIQGALFGLGFHFIAGLRYGLPIGVMLGLFNIIPYLGNIVCLPMILLFAFFGAGGGSGTAGAVVALFCAVQALDGYFITPRVMGGRVGLNPFVIIFSIFFWEAVIGGALGMVLAIPLSAFIVVFWRLLKKEYFPEPPAEPGAAQ